MLVTKFLTALVALPLAFAQESAAAPAATSAGSNKPPSVGADSSNTGHGTTGNSTADWQLSNFTTPNRNTYWVNGIENVAAWTPYTEPVNIEIYNSNSTVYSNSTALAKDIAAGTGFWKGTIPDFVAGNNYILILTLASDPTRKIAQTDGFWIRAAGTTAPALPADIASSISAASSPTAGASGSGSAPSGAHSSAAAAASASAKSGAKALGVSAAAVVVAAGVAAAF